MPELPEVETTRKGIAPHIEQQVIQRVVVRNPKLRWPVPDNIIDYHGAKIGQVERRAKYLIVNTSKGQLIMHLGMSGSLRICSAEEPAGIHDHFDVVLNNGRALRYRDPRRFGALLTTNNAYEHSLLASLGPEPMSNAFTGKHLYEASRGKTRVVKKFLMDNKVVVGAGNIYANEALFRAGIRPTVAAGKISLVRYEKLADAVVAVLAQAIEAGGTTLKDFVDSEGKPGYFANELQVYGCEEMPCVVCDTPLSGLRIDNRATVFCKKCQR